MHGQVSQDSFYWTKATWRKNQVRGETDEETNDLKTRQVYGQICGSICLMQREEKRSKSRLSRNQSSIMPEDHMVFSSFILIWRNSNVQWQMLVECEKFRCQRQCLVDFNFISTGKPVAQLDNTRRNMLMLSKLTNLWEYDWKEYRRGIMKITSLQKELISSLSHYNLVHTLIPMPQTLK